MTDLATREQCKEWLGIATLTTTLDDLIDRLITAASGFIANYCDVPDFGVAVYTEKSNGVGSRILSLKNSPVVSVTSVSIDNVSIPLAANSTQVGYMSDARAVYLNGYLFSVGLQNVVVVYSAGYASIPAALTQVCIELVGLKVKEKDRIGVNSKAIGGETTSYETKDLTQNMRTALEFYTNRLPI